MVELRPDGNRLWAWEIQGPAGQRAPIDGLLMAVHPLSDTAVVRDCPERGRDERLTLCTPEAGGLTRCSEDEAPAMEERRRRRAAEYLVTPAPARIREVFVTALANPRDFPWPTCAPPCPCVVLDGWRQKADAQHPPRA